MQMKFPKGWLIMAIIVFLLICMFIIKHHNSVA
jgi:hypothetical protein